MASDTQTLDMYHLQTYLEEQIEGFTGYWGLSPISLVLECLVRIELLLQLPFQEFSAGVLWQGVVH